jgi:hypothetical protein
VSRRALALVGLAALVVARPAGADAPPAEAPRGGPEFLHMPLLERRAEQGILRPVPIDVTLPRDVALRARRLLVHYRLWGDPDWISLEARREGARFVAVIPCREISTVTGDLKYYLRVHDAEGRVVAAAGARTSPFVVAIKNDAALDPSAPRAAKCPDPADCPRGLPGCPSEVAKLVACKEDRDCEPGQACGLRGVCERAGRRRSWVGLSVSQDVGFVSATGACSIDAQEHEGTACVRGDGVPYVGTPLPASEPVVAGPGPTRLVASFDRLVDVNVTLGVRLGVALRGAGPTSRAGTAFVPVSAAARATYWFGEDPFAGRHLRPFAFVTAGYAMTDVHAKTRVREDPTAPAWQADDDLEQTVHLWKRAGDGFVGVGAGVAVPLGGPTALVAEVTALEAFPFGAFVLAPTAGMMVGF